MNKQEAIEKLKSKAKPHWLDEEIYGDSCIKSVKLCMAIEIVNQIDEPEKPVVPQYVADWIKWCKRNSVTLLGAMSPIDEFGLAICNDKKVKSLDASKWATQNQEAFARAWLFGYEVEKEKLYTVEIPNPNSAGGKLVLSKQQSTGKLILKMLNSDINKPKYLHLTEAEIKEDFAFLWQFAEEVK